MDKTTLETLEFPSVTGELAGYAQTPLGRELALGLKPEEDLGRVIEAFKDYAEASTFIKAVGRFPLSGVTDLGRLLSRLGPEGAYLLPEELILVRSNLESSRLIKSYLNEEVRRTYPRLSAKMESLSDQSSLYSELNRILDEKGEIRDNATPALNRLRKEIRSSKERARSILEEFAEDKKVKEALQEELITIRDDRYVMCIKAGMHVGVGGIIHGRSGSGATYFIEPIKLVELNNRIAILTKEEKAEEIEILKAATRHVLEARPQLFSDMGIMGAFDFLQAKAQFAEAIRAVVPDIGKNGGVNLRNARHPILIIKEKGGGPKVVPIDVVIPEGKSVLVISGANTGGKTVALKTLGLLTIMALSGLPVPADEGSSVVTFSSIYSDIGDRQDIIASLSTFSAHIKRVREFLEEAGRGSLVLIDEIGVGTDPSEGSALALAALETFRGKGAVTVVTTHLNLLKAHAQVDPNYLNASVEFDEETLKPLYKLRYGVPGPSLGLSIAQSLGISPAVIDKARSYIKEKEGAFIESVRALEEEREEIRKLKDELSALEQRRRVAVERLKTDKAAIVERMRAKAEAAVQAAREEMSEAIAKLREERAGARASAARIEEAGKKAKERLTRREIEVYVPAEGDKVTIQGSNSKGTVLKVDKTEKKAELMVGNMKVWVAWEKLSRKGGVERARSKGVSIEADIEAGTSINVIGLRVEEALPIIERLIDNAHASGLGSVEIIHGIGTGLLAKGIREYLSKHPIVKGFHHGDPARGGGGVTIVELK